MNIDNLNTFKKGVSGNPSGRPKGSLNRKTVAREYLAFLQEEVNPLTGIKELLLVIHSISRQFKGQEQIIKFPM